jgi:hypothetical protein
MPGKGQGVLILLFGSILQIRGDINGGKIIENEYQWLLIELDVTMYVK